MRAQWMFAAAVLLGVVAEPADGGSSPGQDYPPLGAYDHSCKIQQTYNRIDDRGTLKVDLGRIIRGQSHRVNLAAYRFFDGKSRSKGPVNLNFLSYSTDGWVYLKHRPITLLIDGERWKFEPDHDGDVEKGYVLEHIWISLTESRFLKLVNAKSVEGEIGGDEFAFTNAQMQALKDFASYLGNPEVEIRDPVKIAAEAARAEAETEAEARKEADPTYQPKAGDVALLFFKKYAYTLAAKDRASYREMAHAILAKNDPKLEELRLASRIIDVPARTKIRVEAVRDTPDATNDLEGFFVEATIVDGPFVDTKIWVHGVAVNRPAGGMSLKVDPTPREAARARIVQKMTLAKSLESSNSAGAISYYKEVLELATPDSAEAKAAKARIKALTPKTSKK